MQYLYFMCSFLEKFTFIGFILRQLPARYNRLSDIFTILIQNSEKQWKILLVFLNSLPTGSPSGNQTVLWDCAPQDSLGTSLMNFFPDNPSDE